MRLHPTFFAVAVLAAPLAAHAQETGNPIATRFRARDKRGAKVHDEEPFGSDGLGSPSSGSIPASGASPTIDRNDPI
jgi:hypothetical protein